MENQKKKRPLPQTTNFFELWSKNGNFLQSPLFKRMPKYLWWILSVLFLLSLYLIGTTPIPIYIPAVGIVLDESSEKDFGLQMPVAIFVDQVFYEKLKPGQNVRFWTSEKTNFQLQLITVEDETVSLEQLHNVYKLEQQIISDLPNPVAVATTDLNSIPNASVLYSGAIFRTQVMIQTTPLYKTLPIIKNIFSSET